MNLDGVVRIGIGGAQMQVVEVHGHLILIRRQRNGLAAQSRDQRQDRNREYQRGDEAVDRARDAPRLDPRRREFLLAAQGVLDQIGPEQQMLRGLPQLDDLLALAELDDGFEPSLQIGAAIGNRCGAAAIDVHAPRGADTVGYPRDRDEGQDGCGDEEHERLQVKCRKD